MTLKTILIDGMEQAAEEQYQTIIFIDKYIDNKIIHIGYGYEKTLDYAFIKFRLLRCILVYIIIDKVLRLCQ